MIPPVSSPAWERLITGEKEIRSQNLSFNMMIFNLKLSYRKNPTPSTAVELSRQAQQFFVKFERLLPEEIKELTK